MRTDLKRLRGDNFQPVACPASSFDAQVGSADRDHLAVTHGAKGEIPESETKLPEEFMLASNDVQAETIEFEVDLRSDLTREAVHQ